MGSAKDHVVTSSGREVGKLMSLQDDLVHLKGKDYWLPASAIEYVDDEAVRLREDYDYLGGPQPGKSRGVMSGATRLALLGLIARTAYTYRDETKRKKLVSKAKELTERAKAELNRAKTEMEKARSKGAKMDAGSLQSSIPAFSTLDLSDRTVGVMELEVTAKVTQAFPENTVRTEAIGVHKADGSEVGTLRFTVDERASSDIELNRLESDGASAEVMAQEVIANLRAQLPSAM